MEDIKILLLQYDQQVIAKVSEIRTDNDEPYCFLLEVPMVLNFAPDSTPEDPKITMAPLIPFTKNWSYRMPFAHVVTMGIPTDSILNKYVEVVKPHYPIDGGAEPNKVENKLENGEETND